MSDAVPTVPAVPETHLPAPSEIWVSDRAELQALLHEARRRIASPWALLTAAISRSLLTIPYRVRYRSDLFPEGSPLNLALALVGRSGAGKSTAIRGAACAVTFVGEDVPETALARSGEAIATMLGRVQTAKDEDPELVYARADHAVWLHWDEVGQLAQQGDRTGSTMLETVKSVMSGETLGGQNAKGDGVTIPAGSYRAVLTVGVQPRRAGPLLSEGAVASGLAARFLWMAAEDPEAAIAPRPEGAQPAVQVTLHQWDGVRFVEALPVMNAAHEIDARAAQAAEREPISSRVLLNRAIIAIALANMAGRAHLTPEDWHLAGAVIAHSLETLDAVADALAEPDDAELERAQRLEQRTRERLAKLKEQGIPFGDIERHMSRPQRAVFTKLKAAGKIASW